MDEWFAFLIGVLLGAVLFFLGMLTYGTYMSWKKSREIKKIMEELTEEEDE